MRAFVYLFLISVLPASGFSGADIQSKFDPMDSFAALQTIISSMTDIRATDYDVAMFFNESGNTIFEKSIGKLFDKNCSVQDLVNISDPGADGKHKGIYVLDKEQIAEYRKKLDEGIPAEELRSQLQKLYKTKVYMIKASAFSLKDIIIKKNLLKRFELAAIYMTASGDFTEIQIIYFSNKLVLLIPLSCVIKNKEELEIKVQDVISKFIRKLYDENRKLSLMKDMYEHIKPELRDLLPDYFSGEIPLMLAELEKRKNLICAEYDLLKPEIEGDVLDISKRKTIEENQEFHDALRSLDQRADALLSYLNAIPETEWDAELSEMRILIHAIKYDHELVTIKNEDYDVKDITSLIDVQFSKMSNPKYQWLYDEYDQLRTMSKEMPDFFDDKVEETVWDINPEMPDSQALGLKEDCENAGTEFRRLRDRFEALSEAFDHD